MAGSISWQLNHAPESDKEKYEDYLLRKELFTRYYRPENLPRSNIGDNRGSSWIMKSEFGATQCPECGAHVEKKKKDQRFCSPVCRNAWHNKRIRKAMKLLEEKEQNDG